MAHTVVVLNGRTVLDDPLDQWQQRPPEILAAMISPQAVQQPWMKCLGLALVDAALGGVYTHIDVRSEDGGWSIEVTHR